MKAVGFLEEIIMERDQSLKSSREIFFSLFDKGELSMFVNHMRVRAGFKRDLDEFVGKTAVSILSAEIIRLEGCAIQALEYFQTQGELPNSFAIRFLTVTGIINHLDINPS